MHKQFFKFDFFNFSPVILLIWGVFSILFIPVIPIASGFGWDGVFYGKVALDFQNMIGNMDSYHAGRIFPGILIYYLFVFLHISLNLASVLLAFQIYNIITLVFSAYIWVCISKYSNLNQISRWFGFIALFLNYPVLNFYFYYPPLTDGTAFFIGLLMLYSCIKKNNFVLLIVTILSFFSWPTGIVIGLLIYMYTNIKNEFWSKAENTFNKFILLILILFPLFVLVIGFSNVNIVRALIISLGLDNNLFHQFNNPPNRLIFNDFYIFINSLIIVSYFFIVYYKFFNDFDIFSFLKLNLTKPKLIKILIVIFILIILTVFKYSLFNPSISTLTLKEYAYSVITRSTRYPLQFLICHISYWGPSILLLIIFWTDVIKFLKNSNLAIMLGFLFTILFSVNAESRAITNFYPFIVFIIIKSVDLQKFKNIRLLAFLFIFTSLLYSKIWLNIKLPSTIFPETIESNLDKFPMQWHFMNFGLWINSQMYIVHALGAIIFFALFYCFLKNQTLSQNKINQ